MQGDCKVPAGTQFENEMTDEILKLAETANSTDSRVTANPATILAMIELIEQMKDALEDCNKHVECGRMLARNALAAYARFNGGE